VKARWCNLKVLPASARNRLRSSELIFTVAVEGEAIAALVVDHSSNELQTLQRVELEGIEHVPVDLEKFLLLQLLHQFQTPHRVPSSHSIDLVDDLDGACPRTVLRFHTMHRGEMRFLNSGKLCLEQLDELVRLHLLQVLVVDESCPTSCVIPTCADLQAQPLAELHRHAPLHPLVHTPRAVPRPAVRLEP
jgi:hypothetical protein